MNELHENTFEKKNFKLHPTGNIEFHGCCS